MTPYALYHQYRSHLNHRLNAGGDGLLCGRPLPARGEQTQIARSMCHTCALKWYDLKSQSMALLRASGCRCYIPTLVLDGRTATCRECGAVAEEPTP